MRVCGMCVHVMVYVCVCVCDCVCIQVQVQLLLLCQKREVQVSPLTFRKPDIINPQPACARGL